ncbi:hypothetical protein FGB62_2g120 [Gracilaria domingensis]|nr:hypothetical protein FGB62_2g120 [Gracilaria domingensis]
MMFKSYTFFITCLLLSITVCTASINPCDEDDPKSLCLTPLKHRNWYGTSTTLRRRGGGSSGGSGGSRRRPFRRPGRRPGSFGDDDDDDEVFGDEEEEENDASDFFDIDEDDDDDDLCFPANAIVNTLNRGDIVMHQLQIGDAVQVASQNEKRYSQVFSFSHRVQTSLFPFKSLITDKGALTVTSGHYVYTRNKLMAAKSVRPGDELQLADASYTKVLDVQKVWRTGLYNPQTIDGELVVDGFRVSSYTTSVEANVANALLSPLRAMYQLFGIDVTGGALERPLVRWLLPLIPSGGKSMLL